MSKKYIYMLFIFLFFVISTSIFSFDYFKLEQVKKVYNSKDLKCKYTISNIKEEKENYNIIVYYPITQSKELNNNILQNVNYYIENFKNNLSSDTKTLIIKFNSTQNDKYTSFVFDVIINNDNLHDEKYVFTCNYDNDKNKMFTIEDLLASSNDSLNKISNAVFNNLIEQENIKDNIKEEVLKEYLDLNKEKYECFYFNKNSIVFCFNIETIAPKSIGVIYATIQYKDII